MSAASVLQNGLGLCTRLTTFAVGTGRGRLAAGRLELIFQVEHETLALLTLVLACVFARRRDVAGVLRLQVGGFRTGQMEDVPMMRAKVARRSPWKVLVVL